MGYADGDSLRVRIRIAFGANPDSDGFSWAWTDVTRWWHVPDDVQIQWGRSPGATGLEASTLSLTLKNSDGRFTPGHGGSPYWPHVVQWMPIAYDIDLGDGQGWRQRFGGYIKSWGVDWPGSALAAYARVQAVGESARLSRGKPPALWPIRRTLGVYASAPELLAYWPLEDEATSTQGASAKPSGAPMSQEGTAGWGQYDVANDQAYARYRRGTASLVELAGDYGASLMGEVTPGASSPAAWTLHAYARHRLETISPTPARVLMEWRTTGGTHDLWQYGYALSGSWLGTTLRVRNADTGAWTVVFGSNSASAGPGDLGISARQNGSNSIQVWVRPDSSWSEGPLTVSGRLGRITGVTLNPGRISGASQIAFGHVRVWDRHDAPMMPGLAVNAYRPEEALTRLERLRAEAGTSWLHIDPPPMSRELLYMGPQPAGTTLDLYQDVEKAEGGLLYERGHSLGYLPLAARYAPPVALTLDMSASEVGTPALRADDQHLRNRIHVSRPDGSSVVVEDPDAVERHGALSEELDPNVYHDIYLEPIAWWRLRQGTVQEPRVAAITVSLHSAPHLAGQWVGCREGARVQVVNPPPQSGMDRLDQIITGATETYGGRRRWTVTLSTVPADPWLVLVADGSRRAGSSSTMLEESLSATGTQVWVVTTPADGPWTTDPAHYPMDLRIGGERVRVSGMTGTSYSQRLTISQRGVNGVRRSWPAGTRVDVWDPAHAGL